MMNEIQRVNNSELEPYLPRAESKNDNDYSSVPYNNTNNHLNYNHYSNVLADSSDTNLNSNSDKYDITVATNSNTHSHLCNNNIINYNDTENVNIPSSSNCNVNNIDAKVHSGQEVSSLLQEFVNVKEHVSRVIKEIRTHVEVLQKSTWENKTHIWRNESHTEANVNPFVMELHEELMKRHEAVMLMLQTCANCINVCDDKINKSVHELHHVKLEQVELHNTKQAMTRYVLSQRKREEYIKSSAAHTIEMERHKMKEWIENASHVFTQHQQRCMLHKLLHRWVKQAMIRCYAEQHKLLVQNTQQEKIEFTSQVAIKWHNKQIQWETFHKWCYRSYFANRQRYKQAITQVTQALQHLEEQYDNKITENSRTIQTLESELEQSNTTSQVLISQLQEEKNKLQRELNEITHEFSTRTHTYVTEQDSVQDYFTLREAAMQQQLHSLVNDHANLQETVKQEHMHFTLLLHSITEYHTRVLSELSWEHDKQVEEEFTAAIALLSHCWQEELHMTRARERKLHNNLVILAPLSEKVLRLENELSVTKHSASVALAEKTVVEFQMEHYRSEHFASEERNAVQANKLLRETSYYHWLHYILRNKNKKQEEVITEQKRTLREQEQEWDEKRKCVIDTYTDKMQQLRNNLCSEKEQHNTTLDMEIAKLTLQIQEQNTEIQNLHAQLETLSVANATLKNAQNAFEEKVQECQRECCKRAERSDRALCIISEQHKWNALMHNNYTRWRNYCSDLEIQLNKCMEMNKQCEKHEEKELSYNCCDYNDNNIEQQQITLNLEKEIHTSILEMSNNTDCKGNELQLLRCYYFQWRLHSLEVKKRERKHKEEQQPFCYKGDSNAAVRSKSYNTSIEREYYKTEEEQQQEEQEEYKADNTSNNVVNSCVIEWLERSQIWIEQKEELEEQHAHAVQMLLSELYKFHICEMKKTHQYEMEKLETSHKDYINDLTEQQNSVINTLTREHEWQLLTLTKSHKKEQERLLHQCESLTHQTNQVVETVVEYCARNALVQWMRWLEQQRSRKRESVIRKYVQWLHRSVAIREEYNITVKDKLLLEYIAQMMKSMYKSNNCLSPASRVIHEEQQKDEDNNHECNEETARESKLLTKEQISQQIEEEEQIAANCHDDKTEKEHRLDVSSLQAQNNIHEHLEQSKEEQTVCNKHDGTQHAVTSYDPKEEVSNAANVNKTITNTNNSNNKQQQDEVKYCVACNCCVDHNNTPSQECLYHRHNSNTTNAELLGKCKRCKQSADNITDSLANILHERYNIIVEETMQLSEEVTLSKLDAYLETVQLSSNTFLHNTRTHNKNTCNSFGDENVERGVKDVVTEMEIGSEATTAAHNSPCISNVHVIVPSTEKTQGDNDKYVETQEHFSKIANNARWENVNNDIDVNNVIHASECSTNATSFTRERSATNVIENNLDSKDHRSNKTTMTDCDINDNISNTNNSSSNIDANKTNCRTTTDREIDNVNDNVSELHELLLSVVQQNLNALQESMRHNMTHLQHLTQESTTHEHQDKAINSISSKIDHDNKIHKCKKMINHDYTNNNNTFTCNNKGSSASVTHTTNTTTFNAHEWCRELTHATELYISIINNCVNEIGKHLYSLNNTNITGEATIETTIERTRANCEEEQEKCMESSTNNNTTNNSNNSSNNNDNISSKVIENNNDNIIEDRNSSNTKKVENQEYVELYSTVCLLLSQLTQCVQQLQQVQLRNEVREHCQSIIDNTNANPIRHTNSNTIDIHNNNNDDNKLQEKGNDSDCHKKYISTNVVNTNCREWSCRLCDKSNKRDEQTNLIKAANNNCNILPQVQEEPKEYDEEQEQRETQGESMNARSNMELCRELETEFSNTNDKSKCYNHSCSVLSNTLENKCKECKQEHNSHYKEEDYRQVEEEMITNVDTVDSISPDRGKKGNKMTKANEVIAESLQEAAAVTNVVLVTTSDNVTESVKHTDCNLVSAKFATGTRDTPTKSELRRCISQLEQLLAESKIQLAETKAHVDATTITNKAESNIYGYNNIHSSICCRNECTNENNKDDEKRIKTLGTDKHDDDKFSSAAKNANCENTPLFLRQNEANHFIIYPSPSKVNEQTMTNMSETVPFSFQQQQVWREEEVQVPNVTLLSSLSSSSETHKLKSSAAQNYLESMPEFHNSKYKNLEENNNNNSKDKEIASSIITSRTSANQEEREQYLERLARPQEQTSATEHELKALVNTLQEYKTISEQDKRLLLQQCKEQLNKTVNVVRVKYEEELRNAYSEIQSLLHTIEVNQVEYARDKNEWQQEQENKWQESQEKQIHKLTEQHNRTINAMRANYEDEIARLHVLTNEMRTTSHKQNYVYEQELLYKREESNRTNVMSDEQLRWQLMWIAHISLLHEYEKQQEKEIEHRAELEHMKELHTAELTEATHKWNEELENKEEYIIQLSELFAIAQKWQSSAWRHREGVLWGKVELYFRYASQAVKETLSHYITNIDDLEHRYAILVDEMQVTHAEEKDALETELMHLQERIASLNEVSVNAEQGQHEQHHVAIVDNNASNNNSNRSNDDCDDADDHYHQFSQNHSNINEGETTTYLQEHIHDKSSEENEPLMITAGATKAKVNNDDNDNKNTSYDLHCADVGVRCTSNENIHVILSNNETTTANNNNNDNDITISTHGNFNEHANSNALTQAKESEHTHHSKERRVGKQEQQESSNKQAKHNKNAVVDETSEPTTSNNSNNNNNNNNNKTNEHKLCRKRNSSNSYNKNTLPLESLELSQRLVHYTISLSEQREKTDSIITSTDALSEKLQALITQGAKLRNLLQQHTEILEEEELEQQQQRQCQ